MENFVAEISKETEDFFEGLKTGPIVLFGAGGKGNDTLEALRKKGIEPLCFCDNDPSKQGRKYCGLDVYDYETFRNTHNKYTILVTTTTEKAKIIIGVLKNKGEKNKIIHCCTPFKIDNVFYNVNDLVKNAKGFEVLYENLADEKSKEVFIKSLYYKCTGNGLPLHDLIDGDTFFDKTILPQHNEHIYVDVGAYTGDTLLRFYAFCGGNYKKIIAIEPDKTNFSNLQSLINYGLLDNVELLNFGVWEKDDVLSFYKYDNDTDHGFANVFKPVLGIVSSNTTLNKNIKRTDMVVKTIDSMLNGENATIIKINAMAADFFALKGAKKTIEKYHPALISYYGATPDNLCDFLDFITSPPPVENGENI